MIRFYPLILLFTLLFLATQPTAAQEDKMQTVRGKVVDQVTRQGLPGANVVITSTEPQLGAMTDSTGSFRLKDVPVGRVTLAASYLGYESALLQNLVISSAKEKVVTIALEENVTTLNEVVVEGKEHRNGAPENKMASISARTFSVEETQRYAGSMMDPARMAASFAGVSSVSDARNDIVIRGNAPSGLLWQLENLTIPNPNHFTFSGSSGGIVSILNTNLLADSDFYTGAFPAEYGNALSGVFDLQLRTGNNEQHEQHFQMGLNGLELGAEGPLSKGGNASYLVAYRYNSIYLMQKMGIDFNTTAIPDYQDLTFVVNIPANINAGRFKLFGIAGKSEVTINEEWENAQGDPVMQGETVSSRMGVTGLSHLYYLTDRTRLTTTLAWSGRSNGNSREYTNFEFDTSQLTFNHQTRKGTWQIDLELTNKLNAANIIRGGFNIQLMNYTFADSTYHSSQNDWDVLYSFGGRSTLLQSFLQWKHKFSEALSITSGLHYQHFTLNHSYNLEPRLGARWMFAPGQTLTFGTGLHGNLQPLNIYNITSQRRSTGETVQANKDLDMTKSAHVIAGYENRFKRKWRFKAEAYYQRLFDVPVENHPDYFSMLNAGSEMGNLPVRKDLVNHGVGRNYGLDLTVEKFFSNRYYTLLTASLFQSKYRGSDGEWRNTAFNYRHQLSTLGGYEFPLQNDAAISLDGKVTWVGGRPVIPINPQKSENAGYTIRDVDRAYEERWKDYFRADLKLSLRLNGKRASQSISLDIQNVLNANNVFKRYYNPAKDKIVSISQMGVFPMIFYRVEF